jgi:3-hydroxyacyl-CoA dehydrogenase/enoyl-CoA hydratase/carnithine racemase
MPEASHIKLSIVQPDIAVITFDAADKGANILSRPVLEELDKLLDQLEQRKDLKGLILDSAKPGIFIFGADVREFVAAKSISREQKVEMSTRGRKLFQRLSHFPCVTVVAIDGGCFGGGAELSMWCDRRIMSTSPKAQMGFPEVKLGIYPGWGGTARAPRLIGLSNAVEMVTGGENVDARTAFAMGLVSDVVPSEKLREAAVNLIRAENKSQQYLQDRKRWDGPIEISETELMFLGVTANAYIQQQTKGQYPAPIAALEVMIGSAGGDIEAAAQAEAQGFADLFGSPINRSLLNIFFLTDRNKKETGVADPNVKPKAIGTVGIFGAGIMGAGIAAATVRRDMGVTITDAMPKALAGGVQKVLEEVSFNKATRGADPQKMLKYAPLVNATVTDNEFAQCDLVIEAIIEKPEAKQELYARIEPKLKDGAILASNTSAISITRLAEKLKHPDRFVGIHFFNPVRKMPLVEVIRGAKTSDETIATAVAYAKTIGKSPIVVNDGPGFLVNRLLLPYMTEALELLREGVEIKAIERAAKVFGMPMGPITLYDVVGLDTCYHAGRVMHEAFPTRVVESPILEAMVKAGRIGQKAGVGFFAYTGKGAHGTPDPSLAGVIGPHVGKPQKLSDEQIIQRLFLPMVLEATRILAEKKVAGPQDVDLGLIFGTGFPPFKGGLLFWADTVGAGKIIEQLKPFAALGERYQPTPMLTELAASGRGFYDLSH